MSFSENLKECRIKAGYTQDELASMIGIAKSTLSGYESGTREPDLFKIKKIAAVLHISADYLLETEKSSDPEISESEDIINERAVKLYHALLGAGFVKEGQELTAQQVDFLDGICSVISAFFDQSK